MAPVDLPSGPSTVRVRLIDTHSTIAINAQYFITPVPSTLDTLEVPTLTYLIDHPTRRILFDLGTRHDYWTHPPAVQASWGKAKHIVGMRIDTDVPSILLEAGITLDSIDAIIWSHQHYDHTGDPGLFPSSTSLILHPDLTTHKAYTTGYPTNPKSPIQQSALTNRTVISAPFETSIAGFPAHDLFGDASFFLLDVPGHCRGHMCALARTRASPDSWIFLGGDVAHTAAVLRPSSAWPMPESIVGQEAGRSSPLVGIPDVRGVAYSNVKAARDSVAKVMGLDADERVLVCLAHDGGLRQLPTVNVDLTKDLNGWREKGWKEKVRWGFLGALDGRRRVNGFWKNRKPWAYERWRDGGKL